MGCMLVLSLMLSSTNILYSLPISKEERVLPPLRLYYSREISRNYERIVKNVGFEHHPNSYKNWQFLYSQHQLRRHAEIKVPAIEGEWYSSNHHEADALFNTVDALLTETQAHSFPELSLSPLRCLSGAGVACTKRSKMDRLTRTDCAKSLRSICCSQSRGNRCGWASMPPVLSALSRRPRLIAPWFTSRTWKTSSKPISSGWQFSTVVLLPEQPSSWTAVLDQQRIRSDQTSVEVAAAQLRQLAPLLGCRPIVASDRWYSFAPDLVADRGTAVRQIAAPQTQAGVVPCGFRAKMGSAFNVETPAHMGRPMAVGRAAMSTDIPSRSAGGMACICPRHGTSK